VQVVHFVDDAVAKGLQVLWWRCEDLALEIRVYFVFPLVMNWHAKSEYEKQRMGK
jgi:uncharacterized membrane protein YhhN